MVRGNNHELEARSAGVRVARFVFCGGDALWSHQQKGQGRIWKPRMPPNQTRGMTQEFPVHLSAINAK